MMIGDSWSYRKPEPRLTFILDPAPADTYPMTLALPPTLCPRAYDPASPLPAEFIKLSLPIPFG